MKGSGNQKEGNHLSRRFVLVMIVITLAVALIPVRVVRSYQQQEDKKVSIIFISKRIDVSNDFWSLMVEGVSMAAKEYNVALSVMGPESETDIEGQNAMIEDAIRRKPDAIALVPSDYTETIPYAKKIKKAGIKLILMDSLMEEEIGLCAVATDNSEGGRKMGEFLMQYADESAVIGIVGHSPSSSTAMDREKGLRLGLKQYEKQIAEVVYCYSDREKAYRVTLDMLKQNPDMNMIAGLNEDSAVGAAKAVKDAGLAEQIRLVGFDNSVEEVQMLEEGVFNAIVIQKPFSMGYLGIQAAYKAVLGEPVPQSIDSGSELITKDTIYTKENEKLLFPFRQSDKQ